MVIDKSRIIDKGTSNNTAMRWLYAIRYTMIAMAAVILMLFPVSIKAHASTTDVPITVTYCQTEARKCFDYVNSFRTGSDAWYWNSDNTTKTDLTGTLGTLTYDYDLEKVAMQRAAEIALAYGHTRPNDTSTFTALSEFGYSYNRAGENIAAGQTSAYEVYEDWREDEDNYSGQGHRRNMLGSRYTAMAMGCVYYEGYYYWVQLFSGYNNNETATAAVDSSKDVTVVVSDENFTSVTLDSDTVNIVNGYAAYSNKVYPVRVIIETANGGSITWPAGYYSNCSYSNYFKAPLTNLSPDWVSADTSIATYENGIIYGKGVGTTTLTATVGTKVVTATVNITADSGSGSGNTGSGNSGSGDAGSGNSGSGDTGSGNSGSGDTGSGNSGSGDAGSGSSGSGDSESGNGSDGSGSGNVTPDQETKVENFVIRLYNVCLDRDPDESGLEHWKELLISGERSGSQVAAGFIFSDEFKAHNYCNTCYVKHLYNAFMGRDYDEDGMQHWLDVLQAGNTREYVFNRFVASAEFQGICADYGIICGEGVGIPEYGTIPTGTCSGCGAIDDVTGFVTRLYNICLDRDPDESGLNHYCTALWNHERSGSSVARSFIFSDEFVGKNYDDPTYVEYLYNAFMDRASDEAGKQHWVEKLQAGSTREDIFNSFANSPEFDNICKRYGITR